MHYVIRDEARHVTFGVNYLEDFLSTLSEEEVEDRAMFAYEACVVMRDRIINTELPARWFNISEEEIREMIINDETQDMFTNLLFSRVMPNLKRIGLLTDKVLPLYEKLNLTSYMDHILLTLLIKISSLTKLAWLRSGYKLPANLLSSSPLTMVSFEAASLVSSHF